MAFFQRLGVPNADSLNPEDLDWMLESGNKDEQSSLLEFLTSPQLGHLTADKNVLTNSELERWSDLQLSQPDAILSGELLEQALRLVKDTEEGGEPSKDIDQLTDQELEKLVADRREALCVQDIELEASERLCEAVAKSKSDLRRDLAKLEDRERRIEADIVSKQSKLLNVDQKRRAGVNEIGQQVRAIAKTLLQDFSSNQSTFLGAADVESLMGEDRDIRGDIEKFARDRFATKTDTRSPEDRLKVAAEANSLFKAYQVAESQALMRGAEVKAAQAAAKEIDHQASKITQMSGLCTGSLDESSLLSMIRDLEATVAKIDKEMEDLTKGSLTKHLQAKSQGYLTKIHQIEADSEIKRKEACESVMDMVIDLLQHQAAYQEVLALLLEHEWKGLQGLKSTMQTVTDHVESEKDVERKVEAHANHVAEAKSRLSRKTVQPEDKHLITLHKLMSKSEVDSCMLTSDEVLRLVTSFQQNLESSKRHVKETEDRWQSQRQQVEDTIRSIHSQLKIDDLNRGGVLVNPEVTKKLQQAKIKLRDYETAVKAEIKDLAKEKQELKGHPLLGVKRIIGRDLMDYAAS